MGRRTTKKQVLDLTTAAKRAELPERKAPYSRPLGKGVALLLYVGVSRPVWKSRTPKDGDKVIGPAALHETTDLPPMPSVGDTGQTFEQARTVALARLNDENMTREDKAAAKTFGEIWSAYTKWAEADGKTDQAMTLIHSYGLQIAPLFPLPAVTTSEEVLKDWCNGLIGTKGTRRRMRTPASVGKVVSALKAACNHSGVKGPWQDLKKPKTAKHGNRIGAAKERIVFAAEEMTAYSVAAGSAEPAFGVLCEGLKLTGARPGELTKATVSDVRTNQATGTTELLIRFGKTAAKTGDRVVHLSPAGQRFFRELVQGRTRNEALFLSHKGESWTGDAYQYLVKRAAEGIGKPGATLYAFRHGYISAAIYNGVPLTSIARNCGTSVTMIEDTYSHAIGSLEQAAFAGLDAALDAGPKLTVVK